MNKVGTHFHPFWAALFLAVPLVMASLPSEAGGKLYRYRNTDGVLVIDYKIPPDYVAKGYDVLSSNGQLLERVPARKQNGEEIPADSLKEIALQREEDHFLLRSYSSIAEIEAARDRKLEMLQREIQIIDKNLGDIRNLRKNEEKRAANQQRGGREVTESLLKLLTKLEQQEEDAIHMLDVRQKEHKQAERRFKAYITRYQQLTQANP